MAAEDKGKIPANVIVGFLGSGKTTAIAKLIDKRPEGENWSILVNEFGKVSIDHALVEAGQGIAVEELGGGCACCTLAFAFQPLLAQFVRRTKPDRLIIEPSGASHPSRIIDVLRNANFSKAIDLRNTICLIDPEDFEDPRWRDSEVFQDQVQLADVVILNWTDCRSRELIDECRAWVEGFRPPKQLIVESSFGEIDPELLDRDFDTVRFPLFADAHPVPASDSDPLQVLDRSSEESSHAHSHQSEPGMQDNTQHKAVPRHPLRFQNDGPGFDACGWIFHVDDVFDRDDLLDLLGYVHPIVRLKGVFRCRDDWWMINRAKDGTSYAPSAYRRDSRLEIILDRKTSGWDGFEAKLMECLAE